MVDQTTSTPTIGTLGKLIAGAYLQEQQTSGGIQKMISLLRKTIGEETAKGLLDATHAQHEALTHLCIDKVVLDRVSPQTTELLKKLDRPSRLLTEAIYLRLTGEALGGSRPEGRWADPLWKMRTMVQKYLELSPSRITDEEVASALKELFVPFIETVREYIKKML